MLTLCQPLHHPSMAQFVSLVTNSGISRMDLRWAICERVDFGTYVVSHVEQHPIEYYQQFHTTSSPFTMSDRFGYR